MNTQEKLNNTHLSIDTAANIKNSAVNHFSSEIIDLSQYIASINKFKWRIFFFACFIALVAAYVSTTVTPIYRATATILIEADQAKAVSFEEIYGLDSNRKEYYATQFEILKSRGIAETVVQRLNLKDHPDFIGKPSFVKGLVADLKSLLPVNTGETKSTLSIAEQEEMALQSLVAAFLGRLTVTPVYTTQLVNISYESSDAKLAALVANTVGEVYIEQNLAAKMGMSQKATGWLTTRLSDLRIQLDASEEKLQQYRERENLVDVSGVLGLVSNELEQTSQQLVVARLERNKLLSIVRVINEYGRDNIELLSSINEITSHSAIQNIKQTLVDVERKVSELSQVYGPKHPKMISAQAEYATVQENLTNQIRRLVTGVEKELTTSERNIAALEQELVQLKSKYQEITTKEYEYKKLSREVETNSEIYDTFLSRSKETEVTSDFDAAVARFTDRAFRAANPIKPNKPLIVMMAFMATLVFGVVCAFVVESANNTFKSAIQVENKLSQPILGLLPLVALKKKVELAVHYFFDDSGKMFSESMRTIRSSFLLKNADQNIQTIEVTSSLPSEGKTTVAINLAFALAQVERTILIDADMRKPSVGKKFGLPSYHPGLSNLIAGTADLTKCIFEDELSGLSVIPCGQLSPGPLELLSSNEFSQVLNELKQSFDRIIIDSPPVQVVSDPLIIAQQVDSVVFVVKAESTKTNVAQKALGRLVQANAKVAGVVLNQANVKNMKSDEYQGYYNDYIYGTSEPENIGRKPEV
ncbi:polysaccharide biosynthesis tyrosine autokinase [Paraglaciecola sp.]|uniref:GumC family protein n=1 Tax=Paraglaciecola sp. TaxID=1920173 RepID=UPI003265ABA5